MKSPVLETFLVGVAFGIGITVLSLRRCIAGVGPNQQFELMGELYKNRYGKREYGVRLGIL